MQFDTNKPKLSYDSADWYLDGILVSKSDTGFLNAPHTVYTGDTTRIDAFSSDGSFKSWIGADSERAPIGIKWDIMKKISAWYDYYVPLIPELDWETSSAEDFIAVFPSDSLEAWEAVSGQIVYSEEHIPRMTGWTLLYDNYNLNKFLMGFKGFVPKFNNSQNDKNGSHANLIGGIVALCEHKNFKGKKKWFFYSVYAQWNHTGFENTISSAI